MSDREAQRLAALARYRILDTPPEEVFDDLTRLAARVCDTPIALISLVDAQRQWFKSRVGVDISETPRALAFCEHAIRQVGVFEVSDTLLDARFADNPFVTGTPHVRFYAGAPLITPDGHALGTLCVIDLVARSLDPEQKDLLAALARQVVTQLEMRRRLRDEQEHGAEALKQRESLLRAVIEGTSDGVFVKDLTGRYLMINAAGAALLGKTVEDMVGRDDWELFDPDSAHAVRTRDLAVIASGRPETCEEPAAVGGRNRVYLSTRSPYFNSRGEVVGVIGISCDITERKRAEEALKQARDELERQVVARTAELERTNRALKAQIADRERAEAALRDLHQLSQQIIASAAEGIVVYDRKLRHVVWNPFMERVTGLSAREVIGRPALELFPQLRAMGIDQLLVRALAGEEVTSPDMRVRDAYSGKPAWIWARFGPHFDGDGRIIGVIALVRDITQRKRVEQALRRSESRYRMLVEQANDIIYETDAEGRFLYFNTNAAFRMLGYTMDEVIGRHFLDVVAPEYRDEVARFYRNQLHNLVPLTYHEFPVLAKDGRRVWVGQNVRLVTEGGRVLSHHVVCRDITERKQREEELERSRQQLRALSGHLQSSVEAERARIAREIHDELGARLTALRMELSQLAQRPRRGADPLFERIGRTINEVDAAIKTVRDIATELRPSILDTFGLWDAIEWQAQEFEERLGIRCELAMDVVGTEVEPERATAVFRIVQEALTNVARHSGADRVWIAARRADQQVIVEVADNGRGFSPGRPDSRRAFGLLGMHERAQMYGGAVTIHAAPGEGTRVELRLPLEAP